ncbi:hypothetical protein GBAR_LOCUS31431 [Geodia barretti]|nr:hypothetical protein GBAR_LOCUS31431 [Geodia barretti]
MRNRTMRNKISLLLPCLKMKYLSKTMFYSGFEGHLRAYILLQKPSLDSNEESHPTGQTSLATKESQTETEAQELESNRSSVAADKDDLEPLYSVAGGSEKHNGTRRNFLTESLLLRGRSRDNTEPGKFTM